MRIEVLAVRGLPEIGEGDDLASLIAGRADLRDGDVLVVAQKAVSKSEGRVVEIDPREPERAAWVRRESVRMVARRGEVIIAETPHGFVCANAGVDASNVPPGRLALLPLDPDGSAARIRERLRSITRADVGVIVSDTFGRPWRVGQTNVAIGVAGVAPLRDHRGDKDAFGNLLEATVIAVADEIAGAAELVMGKAEGIPAALVRGTATAGDGTVGDLIRPAAEDLFRTGAVEAVEARRSVRRFAPEPVDEEIVRRAVAAAITAPAPHGSRVPRPFRFVWLRTERARAAFTAALADAWRRDLAGDGIAAAEADRVIARSDALLGSAPVLLACFVSTAGADPYPDPRRIRAERDMFVAAAGAAIQSLMIALAAQDIGSCWVSSSLFCPDDAAAALGLGPEWIAAGCVAAGHPETPPPPRDPLPPGDALDVR